MNPHVRTVAPELLWRLEIHGWDLLCFEHLDGRAADYSPASPDLPRLVDTMRRLAALPCPDLPPTVFRPAQLRWAELIDDPNARQQLAGDTILHTDYNPSNIIVTSTGDLKMIDWAWPTRGAAWIDPACLVPRLIAWGHTPASAEAVAAQCPGWTDADPAIIDLFAAGLTTMWDAIAHDEPGEDWKQTLATSAKQWLEHRTAPASA
ncbi:aminoglycoside phosphotransferase family protein [Amycolatopsis sp. DSM 110486]|nr:aminoglycoside phosphotransferase family protein [Amycolatopsis sp. DSM 110486]